MHSADMIAPLEAAGYRETSPCCDCQSQVPNRRLRECETCATEGSLLLCADCALRCHKDQDLVVFRAPPAQVSRTPSVRAVAPISVTIDEGIPVVDGGERQRQQGGTHGQPVVEGGHRRHDERNESTDWCGHFKAAILTVFILLCVIPLAAFVVGILFDAVGPLNTLVLLVFALVIYWIALGCHSSNQN